MDARVTPGGDWPERGLVQCIRVGTLNEDERAVLAELVALVAIAHRGSTQLHVSDQHTAQLCAQVGGKLVQLVPGLERKLVR